MIINIRCAIVVVALVTATSPNGNCGQKYLMASQEINKRQMISLKSDVLAKGIVDGKRSYILSVLADSVKFENESISARKAVDKLLYHSVCDEIKSKTTAKKTGTFLAGKYSIEGDGKDDTVMMLRLPINANMQKERYGISGLICFKIQFAEDKGAWKVISLNSIAENQDE